MEEGLGWDWEDLQLGWNNDGSGTEMFVGGMVTRGEIWDVN